MPSIIIADDHQIVRVGVRLLLEREMDFEVLAEAETGDDAVSLTLERVPDVLVLDLSMPGLNGFEVARRLSAAGSATHIVALSMHATEAHVREAFRSGAAAYVRKDAMAGEIVRAIRRVAEDGGPYVSPPLTLGALQVSDRRAGRPGDPYDRLTGRERQVLQLVAARHTNAQIAQMLGVSVRTIEAHRARLMAKLELHGPQELLLYALRRGLTSIDDG